MSNKEHVILIKNGLEAWKSWRRQNPHIKPNLVGADLHGANLSGADLFETDLSQADLTGADLSWADLAGASLREAELLGTNLTGARLLGADLSNANLDRTNLSRADLSRATIIRADLSEANLCSADLTNAIIGYITFGNNDLSTVQGLETVKHFSPSTIGIDTLYKSAGKISHEFLRGAGVPEDFIILVPSLVGPAIEFYSCFISFSWHDQEFSSHLYSRLRSENLRVWFAPVDTQGGKKLHEEIFSAIQIHDKLLLVLSPNSMKSEWVMTEIRRARKVEREENRRKLFPIRLVDFAAIQNWECFDSDSGKDLAVELREYYIPDFSNWKTPDVFEEEFQKLLRDLKATSS